jgi:hypothetical protein
MRRVLLKSDDLLGGWDAWRRAACLAMIAAVVGTCSFPIQQVYLPESTWSLAAVDRKPIESAAPDILVQFPNWDQAVIVTPCQRVETALAIDSDGEAFSFMHPIQETPLTCSHQEREFTSIVLEALMGTTAWSATNSDTIEFVSETTLTLVRVPFELMRPSEARGWSVPDIDDPRSGSAPARG